MLIVEHAFIQRVCSTVIYICRAEVTLFAEDKIFAEVTTSTMPSVEVVTSAKILSKL